jgi:SRSO17 transposase
MGFATRPQIALELMRQAQAEGVPPAPVLGDSSYGNNEAFRDGLRALGLEFCLQIDAEPLAGWAHPVALERKRARWQVRADQPPAQPLTRLCAAHDSVAWQRCTWKGADGKTRHTRLAWWKVYLPGALERGAERLEEVWLVVDWPAGEPVPCHYYLAHLHRPPQRARLLRLCRLQWNLEHCFQRGKSDLGLDHFEGRRWRGFHHHLVLAVLAYGFVALERLRARKNFWCDVGSDAEPDAAVAAAASRHPQGLATALRPRPRRRDLTE